MRVPRCPKCGSSNVQLSNSRNKHGCLMTILFGIWYVFWWFCKALAAFFVLIIYDWWMAIIKKSSSKGYIWVSKRIIQNNSKVYYCHKCGHNFKG